MRRLPDYLIASGQVVVPVETLARLVGLSRETVPSGLQRLRRDGRLFSPARGLHVAVPPEYRVWGVVPAEWFIDPMLAHLGRRYYVSLLTSASMHGAGHQAPHVFQVMVDRQLQSRDLGRVRLQFHVNSLLRRDDVDLPVESRTTHTGMMRVASRELTAVDLVAHPDLSGGLDNVATVLVDLAPLDAGRLASICRQYPRVTARRLGWLLEKLASGLDLAPLLMVAAPAEGEFLPLDQHAEWAGRRDQRWGLIVNTEIQPED